MRLSPSILIFIITAFLLGLLSVHLYNLYSPGEGEVIGICVKKNGQLRSIESNENCDKNEAFIDWKSRADQPPIIWTNITLDGNQIGDRFKGKNLSNAIIDDNRFNNMNFSEANFEGAFITQTEFSGSNMSGANLSNTTGHEKYFDNANLTNANLTNADLTDSTLAGANMKEAKLRGVKWSNTICPDGTNSDNNANTCEGHLSP